MPLMGMKPMTYKLTVHFATASKTCTSTETGHAKIQRLIPRIFFLTPYRGVEGATKDQLATTNKSKVNRNRRSIQNNVKTSNIILKIDKNNENVAVSLFEQFACNWSSTGTENSLHDEFNVVMTNLSVM